MAFERPFQLKRFYDSMIQRAGLKKGMFFVVEGRYETTSAALLEVASLQKAARLWQGFRSLSLPEELGGRTVAMLPTRGGSNLGLVNSVSLRLKECHQRDLKCYISLYYLVIWPDPSKLSIFLLIALNPYPVAVRSHSTPFARLVGTVLAGPSAFLCELQLTNRFN